MTETSTPATITILASRVDEAIERVAKANRKLERAGIADRFELTVGDPYAVKINGETAEDAIDIFKIDIELNTPEIAYAGWTFVATLVAEGDDLITRVAPGQELGGWAPKTAVCDHCSKIRYRNETYVVRNVETGEVKQVGSSCIRLFLGVTPGNLWVLNWDLDDLSASEQDEFGFSSTRDAAYNVRGLVRLAYALTDGGKGFVSRSAVQYGGQSTSDDVFFHLHPSYKGMKAYEAAIARAEHAEVIRKAAELSETVVDEVLAVAGTLSTDTDYGRNLSIVAGKEFIGSKNVALLVSILSVFCKDRQRKAAKAEIASGFIGAVGDKIKDLEVTVQAVRYLDGYMPGTTSTLLVMRTADNHVVKWFASKRIEIEEGDKIIIKSATVKANEVWQGQDQTALTRARIA